MLTPLDYAVIAIYFILVVSIGIKAGGKQRTEQDYFLGGKDLPWWAVCLSIVATETSTLTVIGVPAIAYGGDMTFFQLTLGYLIGRIVVSVLFLPRYFEGSLSTAYGFLGARFGGYSQGIASLTFLLTRLLADGVRLFATAIPIKVIVESAGFDISYAFIISVIGILTIIYTLIGGLRAVVWMDVIQLIVYVIGGVIAVGVLIDTLGTGWIERIAETGKTKVFDIEWGRPAWEILTSPYAFATAVIGGAVFTMASHGTDHLIVQRLLACRSLRDSQWALIGSGMLVIVQFALFLLLGALLWLHFEGAALAELGLSRADEVFPKFILEGLPAGISGFILAGIVAAAMSTLSSSLNALASSTKGDLALGSRFKWASTSKNQLWIARVLTFVWGAVFIGFASLFQEQQNPVVELGLAIATFTYGGLLGIFLLGVANKKINDRGACISLLTTIVLMTLIIIGVRYSETNGWFFTLIHAGSPDDVGVVRSVAWPLYTLMGALIALVIGWLLTFSSQFRSGRP